MKKTVSVPTKMSETQPLLEIEVGLLEKVCSRGCSFSASSPAPFFDGSLFLDFHRRTGIRTTSYIHWRSLDSIALIS